MTDDALAGLMEVLASRPTIEEGMPFLQTKCPLCNRAHGTERMPFRLGSLDTAIYTEDERLVGWYCDSCNEIVQVIFNNG